MATPYAADGTGNGSWPPLYLCGALNIYTAGFTLYMVTIIGIYSVKPRT
jgi:hypothetical protein